MASELLEDYFFNVRKTERSQSQRNMNLNQATVVETAVGSPLVLQPPAPSSRNSLSSDDAPGATCEVGLMQNYQPALKQIPDEGKKLFVVALKGELAGDWYHERRPHSDRSGLAWSRVSF